MTMTLEIKPATTFDVTLRSRPMKLKNNPGLPAAAPASKECRKGLVVPGSRRRDYLRALRAAEMAAWEAADRPSPTPATTDVAQPQQLTAELSATLTRHDKWEAALYAVFATAAFVALLANVGALSRFATGWSHFAGLVERVLS